MPLRPWTIAMVVGYAVAAGLALAGLLEAAILVFFGASLLGVPLMRRP